MDVDMKNKDDGDDKGIVPPTNGGGRDRDYDRDKERDVRDRDYDRDKDRRDRDKERDRDRDRRDNGRPMRPRVGDHWEPERRSDALAYSITLPFEKTVGVSP
ncbi:hypothetical protein NLJ89_g2044 [Agrocybe chaxingu]|uniref:Uncharacterized protein n=1 Tax=Agrocybe chaxingu TaxID=84603 RepID=A0A9W8MYY5_9AGAR|nr:hypothetical protein NLJ89_g2044 [Agrocybe chaxingu]